LGLAVVDEQHRFGVRQRAAMAEKGDGTDVLVMTATPIPRTLQLTLYGDLHITSLRELPPGRTPVTTRLINEEELPRLWRWLDDRFARGDQAYLVYPIIEESEKQDLKAATVEYARLKQTVFPQHHLALVHGRTPADERRTIMNTFRAGEADLLVATTVIEIGVDIPNANIMVIEHAERFGLSQLHQLRGRIRRGKKRAYCIAVAPAHRSGPTGERLRMFEATDDGFKIAESDLLLRGPGELLGARQHGLPALRVANLARDGQLLEQARKDAIMLCRDDPELAGPQWRALRRSLAAAESIWRAG
jgi:ATP-dependent DNA helicase RecG